MKINNFELIILLSKVAKEISNDKEYIINNNNLKINEKCTILSLKKMNIYINFNNYNEIIIK